MGNFGLKWEKFVEAMFTNGGWQNVLEGLRNTLLVAVFGLIIGIVIGTLIAAIEVMPKYKRLPRVLNKICQFYVAFFRGTPLVVQKAEVEEVQTMDWHYLAIPGGLILLCIRAARTNGIRT